MARHLQRDIENLKKKLLALGAKVEKAMRDATQSIDKRDEALAKKVIAADINIDEMEVEIEEDSLKILALHQPVAIDPTAIVEHSIVGPFVSVAAGATVRDSVVRDSILNANSLVERSLLSGSLIGEGAVVKGNFQRLNVGDSSEIECGP